VADSFVRTLHVLRTPCVSEVRRHEVGLGFQGKTRVRKRVRRQVDPAWPALKILFFSWTGVRQGLNQARGERQRPGPWVIQTNAHDARPGALKCGEADAVRHEQR